jgi:hypothetical protein
MISERYGIQLALRVQTSPMLRLTCTALNLIPTQMAPCLHARCANAADTLR